MRDRLAEHPGFSYSAAGTGYRLYGPDGRFVAHCPTWGDLIAEARYAEENRPAGTGS